MDKKDADVLEMDDFKVTRKSISRMGVSKEDLPRKIWKQYARKYQFENSILLTFLKSKNSTRKKWLFVLLKGINSNF